MDNRFLIGVILDSVNVKVWNTVKESFVLAFNKGKLRHDLVYFYQSHIHKVPDSLAKTTSVLLMAKPEKIKIYNALATTFKVIDNELSDDFQRLVIVIMDNFTKKDVFPCSLVLQQQQEASYVFFGLGEKYDKSLKELGIVVHAENNNDLKQEILNFLDELVEERNG